MPYLICQCQVNAHSGTLVDDREGGIRCDLGAQKFPLLGVLIKNSNLL